MVPVTGDALRSRLLALSPAAFEKVAALALSGLLPGQPVRPAAAGRQPGGDGGGGPVRLEAKRYRIGVPDTRALLGGLTSAVTAAPGMTHWVLASTAGLPLQAADELAVAAERQGVCAVVLDWPAAGVPPLAAALVAGRNAVAAAFPDLVPLLEEMASRPETAAAAEAVRAALRTDPPGCPIHDPCLSYGHGRVSATAALDSRYRVVPLMNRDAELAEWTAWAHQGDARAWLLTGDGGMGKTRLLIEVCHRLREQGWRAGFLRETAAVGDRGGLRRQIAGRDPLLIVVDYAERRSGDLQELCEVILEQGASARVRLALLARAAGAWLGDLLDGGGAAAQILDHDGGLIARQIAPAAPQKAAHRRRSRHEVLVEAVRAFALARGGMDGDAVAARLVETVDLDRPDFDRILLLLLEGWRAVFGDDGSPRRSALGTALIREQRYLAKLAPWMRPRPLMATAAWIYMNGGASSRGEALDLLSRCPALAGQGADTIVRLADLFHDVYPGPAWLNPIQPDLLGEALMDAHDP